MSRAHDAGFIIGITGHGNVSRGAQEVVDELDPVEIHPRLMESFTRHEQAERHSIFKIVLEREEKLRLRDGGNFYMEEYMAAPYRFESNLDRYLPHLTLLIHTSYWDERYPRLVTKKLLQDLGRAAAGVTVLAVDRSGSTPIRWRPAAGSPMTAV